MIHIKFNWRKDEEYGGEGWILSTAPNFNASNGAGIAHDVLEHFQGRYTTIADELLAFGSICHIRVDTGYFSRFYNPSAVYHLAADLSRMMNQVADGEKLDVPKHKVHKIERCDWIERDINEAVNVALKDCIQEYYSDTDADDLPDCLKANAPEAEIFKDWIRIGYRRAVKRWSGHENFQVVALFDLIKSKVDKQFSEGEIGDTLHVCVDKKTLDLKMYVDEPAYEFE